MGLAPRGPGGEVMYNLPGILAQIAEITDVETAFKVARAKGGRRVYIPTADRLKPDHWLVEAVGMDKARIIADAIVTSKGDAVDIPLGPAGNRKRIHQAIAQGVAEGRSVSSIVATTGVDDSTVFRHKAKIREERDLPLFRPRKCEVPQ